MEGVDPKTRKIKKQEGGPKEQKADLERKPKEPKGGYLEVSGFAKEKKREKEKKVGHRRGSESTTNVGDENGEKKTRAQKARRETKGCHFKKKM